MINEKFFIDDAKPAVQIFSIAPVSEKEIGHILWGLEEEGVPAEIREVRNGPVEVIAKQAADNSHLNVGIGIDGDEQVAVLHHRDLPGEKPLFSLEAEEFQPTHLRRLGANAARLVKGNPLLFQIDTMHLVEPEQSVQLQQDQLEDSIKLSHEQLEELISMIVMDFLNNT